MACRELLPMEERLPSKVELFAFVPTVKLLPITVVSLLLAPILLIKPTPTTDSLFSAISTN